MKLKEIKTCQKCNLYNNQEPLIEYSNKADIFFIGLSAKKIKSPTETPLDKSTNSGSIIETIKESLKNYNIYKSNLVKCVPLEKNKLRYPNNEEIKKCFKNIELEIEQLKPKFIFLLGNQVSQAFEKKYKIPIKNNFEIYFYNNIKYIKIPHPSYIYIYKRKELQTYINKIIKIITKE